MVTATDVLLWDCQAQSKKAELKEEVGVQAKRDREDLGILWDFFVNVHLLYEDINLLL